MNTTCRACLNYTENGVRLLTLYKHYHYLPIIIMNCTGIKVSCCAFPLFQRKQNKNSFSCLFVTQKNLNSNCERVINLSVDI